jgi:hypothetical protein
MVRGCSGDTSNEEPVGTDVPILHNRVDETGRVQVSVSVLFVIEATYRPVSLSRRTEASMSGEKALHDIQREGRTLCDLMVNVALRPHVSSR